MEVSDKLILACTHRRELLLWVESVQGIMSPAESAVVPAAEVLPGLEQIKGIVRLADGMLLIHNLNAFLSLDEERQIETVLHGPSAQEPNP